MDFKTSAKIREAAFKGVPKLTEIRQKFSIC